MLSLNHHILIITGDGQQHEFRAARLNIGPNSRHDSLGISYHEERRWVFAKALLQGSNRALRDWLVSVAKSKGKTRAIMIIIDLPASLE